MMVPNIIGQQLYFLSLQCDPHQGTYQVRSASTVVGTPDSFTNYNLNRLTYRPPTQDELVLAQASLSDRFIVWNITGVELAAINAPVPYKTYNIVVAGETWVIERVTAVDLMQAYDCLSRFSPENVGVGSKIAKFQVATRMLLPPKSNK